MVILRILNLPLQNHRRSFHLLRSSSISFFSVLNFSLQKSFTSLVKFLPPCIFQASVTRIVWNCFADFLFWCACSWYTEKLLFLYVNFVSCNFGKMCLSSKSLLWTPQDLLYIELYYLQIRNFESPFISESPKCANQGCKYYREQKWRRSYFILLYFSKNVLNFPHVI